MRAQCPSPLLYAPFFSREQQTGSSFSRMRVYRDVVTGCHCWTSSYTPPSSKPATATPCEIIPHPSVELKPTARVILNTSRGRLEQGNCLLCESLSGPHSTCPGVASGGGLLEGRARYVRAEWRELGLVAQICNSLLLRRLK